MLQELSHARNQRISRNCFVERNKGASCTSVQLKERLEGVDKFCRDFKWGERKGKLKGRAAFGIVPADAAVAAYQPDKDNPPANSMALDCCVNSDAVEREKFRRCRCGCREHKRAQDTQPTFTQTSVIYFRASAVAIPQRK